MKLTNEQIEALEKNGFTRWTKNGYDRLYASNEAKHLQLEYHRSGTISHACLDGEQLSNRTGGKVKTMKVWVETETGEVKTNWASSYTADINLINHIIANVVETAKNAGIELMI